MSWWAAARLKEIVERIANSWWSIAIIAALTTLIVFQRWQMTHPRRPEFIHEGERVKAITVESTQKRVVTIDWNANGRGTIIYVTSPDCIWCQRNAEAARFTYQQASTLGWRFIGISLRAEGLTDYLTRYKVPFPVFVDAHHQAAKALKLAVTPETVLVSPSGIVRKVVIGAYGPKNAESLERALGFRLPPAKAAEGFSPGL